MYLSQKQKDFIRKNHRRLSIREISLKLKIDPQHIEKYVQLISSPGELRKKRIFHVIAFSIPLIFFVVLELILRVFNYSGDFSLFISAPPEFSQYKMCNPKVGRRYFFTQPSIPDPSSDLFLKEKPENGYRIFVLGGSTAAGYPYGDNLLFTRVLAKRLADTFPEKYIEIVNTATAAINTYTLLDFMDEILDNEPDAILIYAGHNEFYGALGVASAESLGKFRGIVRLYLKLKTFKTFVLLRDFVAQLKKGLTKLFSGGTVTDPSATLMERLVTDQQIAYQSDVYKLGRRQFRENLEAIVEKATASGVSILISELVSNIRDQRPFVSMKYDTFPRADKVYASATLLQKQKRYQEAKDKYYWAKDLDALRFRATEDFNDIIHELAKKYSVKVVPMKSFFESNSAQGIIGNELMLEHLHPNISGYFLMTNAIYVTMKQHHFISDHWNAQFIKPDSIYRASWGYTVLDSIYGDLKIRILKGGWPFKPKSVPNTAILDFHPAFRAESLAVKIWTDKKFNLERGHFEMASYYEKKLDYSNAYREYNALIALTPFNVSPYLKAADVLIKVQDLNSALPLLYHSINLEDTHYANKWIGQILLNNNKVKESLPYLEKAHKMKMRDTQVLYNLSGAYAMSAQYKKASQVLDQLYEINPNFPDAEDLRRQLNKILKN